MNLPNIVLTTIVALAATSFTAAAADSQDVMLQKIFGKAKAPTAPPLALTAHALVGGDNTIAVSAWSGSLVFEGRTFNGFQTTFAFAEPTADRSVKFANASGTVFFSTLATNAPEAANGVWGASNGIVAEGATENAYETMVTFTDPTADATLTVPNVTGTVRVAQASTAAALTADNQAVTPGTAAVVQLSSDNATAANRTFTLSATGAVTGAVYILIGPASNQCELADTGIQKLPTPWTPGTTDTLTLLFDGTNFIELARADN